MVSHCVLSRYPRYPELNTEATVTMILIHKVKLLNETFRIANNSNNHNTLMLSTINKIVPYKKLTDDLHP